MTDAVLARIRRRRIESGTGQKPTELYTAVATMKEFNLAPQQWHRLSRRDKKILHYFRIIEEYYINLHTEKMKQESEQTKAMANMPRQIMPRR